MQVEELTLGECETVGNSRDFQYVKGRETYKEAGTELPYTRKTRRTMQGNSEFQERKK